MPLLILQISIELQFSGVSQLHSHMYLHLYTIPPISQPWLFHLAKHISLAHSLALSAMDVIVCHHRHYFHYYFLVMDMVVLHIPWLIAVAFSFSSNDDHLVSCSNGFHCIKSIQTHSVLSVYVHEWASNILTEGSINGLVTHKFHVPLKNFNVRYALKQIIIPHFTWSKNYKTWIKVWLFFLSK